MERYDSDRVSLLQGEQREVYCRAKKRECVVCAQKLPNSQSESFNLIIKEGFSKVVICN